jgi:osmotically-inducible protein OsmY
MLPACQRADDTAVGGQSVVPSGSGISGDSSGGSSGDSTVGSSGDSSGASSTLEKVTSSDTVITAKVKAALAQERKVNVADISVETNKGEVILSGFVDSPVQMDQALKIAKNVEGVGKVTNKMKPRTP